YKSRDPECDAARALQAMNRTGVLVLLDRLPGGRSGKPRTIVNIKKAARLTGHRSSGSLFGLHWQGTTTIPHRRIPSPARCLSSARCRNPAPWVMILSRTGLESMRRPATLARPFACILFQRLLALSFPSLNLTSLHGQGSNDAPHKR